MLELNQENILILSRDIVDSYKYRLGRVGLEQDMILKRIIKDNVDTLFGENFNFHDIKSADDYKKAVPVLEYANLKPYIDRAKKEKNILFKDPIYYWAMTSGTSGTHKYIPHTEKSLENWYRGLFRGVASFLLENPECDLLKSKALSIVGPAVKEKVGELPAGYISGIISQVLDMFRNMNVNSEEVNEIEDYNKKMEIILKKSYKADNILGMGGISTFLINFFNFAKDHGYEVLKKEKVEGIEEFLNADNTLNLNAMWPDFKFFLSTGVNIAPYKDSLKKMFPNLWISNFYAGTEGAYAFTLNPSEEGMYLNFDLYYFEFRDMETKEVCSLAEVKLKRQYEVILTTDNGLYRYTNGDIVEFLSVNPPKIKVVGRSNLIMNLAGEKLSDSEIAHTLDEVCKMLKVKVSNYMFFGWIDDKGDVHHCMAIEGDDVDVDIFSDVLFEMLKKNRVSYRRSAGGLFKKPNIIKLQNNAFYKLEELNSNKKHVIGHSKIKHIMSLNECVNLLDEDLIEKSNLPEEILAKF